MTIETMASSNGNDVPNQLIIRDEAGAALFRSYETNIAIRVHGKVYLDEKSWDYSNATGKYRNIFLRETKKETQAKIADGTYTLVDLNDGKSIVMTMEVKL